MAAPCWKAKATGSSPWPGEIAGRRSGRVPRLSATQPRSSWLARRPASNNAGRVPREAPADRPGPCAADAPGRLLAPARPGRLASSRISLSFSLRLSQPSARSRSCSTSSKSLPRETPAAPLRGPGANLQALRGIVAIAFGQDEILRQLAGRLGLLGQRLLETRVGDGQQRGDHFRRSCRAGRRSHTRSPPCHASAGNGGVGALPDDVRTDFPAGFAPATQHQDRTCALQLVGLGDEVQPPRRRH